MTNIQQVVNSFLDKRQDLRISLSKDLINKSALAKYIMEEKQLDVNIDAVNSAIRRYDIGKVDDVFSDIQKTLQKIKDISTRTNMAIITLNKEADIMKNIPLLYSIIDHEKNELLRIVHANIHVIIIINKNNVEKLTKIIPREKIVTIEEVAEINIQFDYHTYKDEPGPGLFALITNELAINQISLKEVISCIPELLIFVSQQDLIEGYTALQKLCKNNS